MRNPFRKHSAEWTRPRRRRRRMFLGPLLALDLVLDLGRRPLLALDLVLDLGRWPLLALDLVPRNATCLTRPRVPPGCGGDSTFVPASQMHQPHWTGWGQNRGQS